MIKELHEKFIRGTLSPREYLENCLAKIEKEDPALRSFLSVSAAPARVQARKAEEMIRSKSAHTLTGIPLAIKDNILIEDTPCTAASKILRNYIAAYDATVVKKLKKLGVVFIGKTNLDEFAMGASTEHSAFFATRNPHDASRVPGGSSGGSAAAVAAGLAAGALGSDTGGSIRNPAALCGVVGLKPTYGSVSRFGLIAMASSLDVIGSLSASVADARILFEAIKGSDPLDATSHDYPAVGVPKREWVIGVPKEYYGDGLQDGVRSSIEGLINALEARSYNGWSFKFEEISLPSTKYALAVYYILVPAEVSANLARYDGVRYAGPQKLPQDPHSYQDWYERVRGFNFGAEAKRRILVGNFVLSEGYYEAYYGHANAVRRQIREEFVRAFAEVDVILTPTMPTTAFKLGDRLADPLKMYLADVYTTTANLAGIPAISIPAGKVGGLPVAIQLLGPHGGEELLFSLGEVIEQTGLDRS